jgi:hypothetical protein
MLLYVNCSGNGTVNLVIRDNQLDYARIKSELVRKKMTRRKRLILLQAMRWVRRAFCDKV